MIRVHNNCRNWSISAEEQHLSRLTDGECRDMVLQILILSPKLRREVQHWLNGGDAKELAEFLHPDQKESPIKAPTVSGTTGTVADLKLHEKSAQ